MTDQRKHIDEKTFERVRALAVCLVLGIIASALALLCWFGPKDTYSDSERRNLAGFPSFTLNSVSSGRFMDQFESYAQDAFPFRDAFRSIKALASENLFHKLDNNDLYLAPVEEDGEILDSIVSMEYPLDESSVLRAGERFRFVYETLIEGSNAHVYAAIIPDKNYYFAKDAAHLSMDYARLFNLVRECMPYATHLDITETLSSSSYYRTDSHWRQECLPATAATLLEGMGATVSNQTYLEGIATDGFYGVYYGQAALPVQPDILSFLTNNAIDAATAYDHQNNRELPVYSLAAADSPNSKDPYDMFLGGPLSLITIESPEASTDEELVVFRDSFASSIAPLFLEHYSRVTLVDIRYISPVALDQFLTIGNQDVLFLYSTLTLNNSETLR